MGKTTIRPATADDLDRMAEIGAVLHGESDHFRRCRYAPEKVKAFLFALMNNDDGLMLVAERDGVMIGGIAAVAMEQWFSFEKIATDITLFILPEHRGGIVAVRLLKAYRDWAKGKGVIYALAGISTGIFMEKTQELYESIGMRHVGPMMEFVMEGDADGN